MVESAVYWIQRKYERLIGSKNWRKTISKNLEMFKTVLGKLHDEAGTTHLGTIRKLHTATPLHTDRGGGMLRSQNSSRGQQKVAQPARSTVLGSEGASPSSCKPHSDDVPQSGRGPCTAKQLCWLGTHPTSASGCSFTLGVWITGAGIRWEGWPDLLCPRSCRGGCCWRGDAAQIVFVSSYCISHLFLLKHKWLKEEGKCEEWEMWSFESMFSLKKVIVIIIIKKINPITIFPKAAQTLSLSRLEIFPKNADNYYSSSLWETLISQNVGKIKTLLNRSSWFSAEEKGKTLDQSNQTRVGEKSVFLGCPFGLEMSPPLQLEEDMMHIEITIKSTPSLVMEL